MEEIKTVVTHCLNFHADDVFAIAILKIIYPDLKVMRIGHQDIESQKKADIRVDVSGRYNHELGDYDHHQAGGAGKRENGIPYAAAGLIWKHYSYKIAGKEVQEYIDKKMIQYIDADDNGVDAYKSDIDIY